MFIHNLLISVIERRYSHENVSNFVNVTKENVIEADSNWSLLLNNSIVINCLNKKLHQKLQQQSIITSSSLFLSYLDKIFHRIEKSSNTNKTKINNQINK